MNPAISRSGETPSWISNTLLYLLLATLVWVVFGQTLQHQFVAYDDQNYVYENPIISRGLTAEGIRSAFTQPHARNWHPLTTLSHMLDCELFGLDPAGHHLTNVLLHAGAVFLLFSVLRAMTGQVWRCAFVAAVFAIHPLRVESVAWVAERKDVLSALLFMLTVGMYVRYVAAPSFARYAGVVVAFTLGLMAKPMLVTLPFLLCLLDYWPLRRLERGGSAGDMMRLRAKLLLEKIPLLLLSVGTGIATLITQRTTVGYSAQTPLLSRLANAATACVTYIEQMFWPANLAVFYPQPIDGIAVAETVAALTLLALVSCAAWLLRKRCPYFIVGWLWYLICLAPVLGLLPVGLQAHADRYTYLPQIGLYIAVTWFAADFLSHFNRGRWIGVSVAAAVLVCLTWLSSRQASTWRSTETLWQHAAAVTTGNDVAHYNLALLAAERGDVADTIRHYQTALARSSEREAPSRLSPALLYNGLGVALSLQGRTEEAMAQYRRAVALRDDFADAHTNLATLLLKNGAPAEAIVHYRKALSVPPDDPELHIGLATALREAGQTTEAVAEYRRALDLTKDPKLSDKLKVAIEIAATTEAPARP
ncbi:MAG: tetratricopeptide repeat protein [Chthoniobacterales bacterium]